MSTTIEIDPTLTMAELLERFPGAQRALFRKYHIGGCSSCGFMPTETLVEVCARNNDLPVGEVVDYLTSSQQQDLQMQISPVELDALLKNGPAPKLIDVRTREEFEAVHLAGSELFTQELMQEMLASWNRSEAVVMICHHGIRSMDAAAYFAGHGFENVKSLIGGMDAWSEQIDPNLPRYHLE
jgi:rhodanese-related sulfurtransferase